MVPKKEERTKSQYMALMSPFLHSDVSILYVLISQDFFFSGGGGEGGRYILETRELPLSTGSPQSCSPENPLANPKPVSWPAGSSACLRGSGGL